MPFRRTLAIVVALRAAAACSNDPTELRVPVDIVANPTSVTLTQGTVTTVGVTVTGIQDPVRLEWQSLAPGIATLDSVPGAGPMSGAIIRGVAPGATSVVVRVAGRPDVADTIAVTVTSPPCMALGPTVSPNQATIAVGDTVRIRANIVRCVAPADTAAVWTSLQPAIANVDSFGLVTGLTPGVATIRVAARSAPNIVAVSTVTVR
jgi:uncharacterized protein YjdB